jgi:ubiquinone/menaquinone biosynthesis C-methylase UbiE
MSPSHPDPYRNVDAQPDPAQLVAALEARSRTASHVRLVRRFLGFARIGAGHTVLEVGCGTGAVLRELAARVGRQGRVVGVDTSRTLIAAARRLLRDHPYRRRLALRVADGTRLPFTEDRFDAAVAVTVLLHVADPLAVVKEMTRVVRPGGVVAVQDQDFGTVALSHPDRALTERIMMGVATRVYEEPWSGRRLPLLLRAAGLERVGLLTDVYQDTRLEPYTKSFLERRAENAVRFGIIEAPTAERWLDAITALVAEGGFVLTLNFYGVAGRKPSTRARQLR